MLLEAVGSAFFRCLGLPEVVVLMNLVRFRRGFGVKWEGEVGGKTLKGNRGESMILEEK